MNADPLPEPAYRLSLMPGRYAVCRLPTQTELPEWAHPDRIGLEYLLSLTWRGSETSLVCPERFVPPEIKAERGWRIIELSGPLDFELVGVLASLLEPLKQAGVSVFSLSTFETDLLLVKEKHLDRATRALESVGHLVVKIQRKNEQENLTHE